MSLKAVLWGLGVSSVLCWIAWFLTITNTNPDQGGQAAVLSFYLSLFAGVFGTVTLVGYAIRRVLSGNELKYTLIRTSFRQGFLVAALLIILLLLQSSRLLSWWDVSLLVVTVVLLELYLRSYGRTRSV